MRNNIITQIKTVKIPRLVSLKYPKWFFKALDSLQDGHSIQLEFASKKPVIDPSGVALLELLKWNASVRKAEIRGWPKLEITFPSHQKYFSIDWFTRSLKPPFFERFKELRPELGERLYDLELLFNELTQNALDHSGSDRFLVLLEPNAIGVFDPGVGVRAKLAQAYSFENDLAALESALKIGVTTRTERPGGFGLYYTLDQLKKNGGYLYFASGRAQLRRYLKSKKIERKKLDPPLRGTIVYCCLEQNRRNEG
ncbi:MAG: hypothetical protein JST80_08700 [Bdellovibrionales bacterium]|nr:hypothetical protein [Bdellovibrionales bacterium]